MNPNTAISGTWLNNSRSFGRIAAGLSVAFLGFLLLLHILEPEFDPSWRMISEYELGRYGWLMSLAFICWSGSVLTLIVALRPSLQTAAGKVGFWWFLVIAIAQLGGGVFITDAITDTIKTTAGNLHTLCGVIVILTFPIAATLVAGSLARNQEWKDANRGMRWLTLLVWLSVIAYFGSIIVSNLANPTAGRVGPHVLQGWPNRAMVTVYSVWLIYAAMRAGRSERKLP
jgi:hypothetical protein